MSAVPSAPTTPTTATQTAVLWLFGAFLEAAICCSASYELEGNTPRSNPRCSRAHVKLPEGRPTKESAACQAPERDLLEAIIPYKLAEIQKDLTPSLGHPLFT